MLSLCYHTIRRSVTELHQLRDFVTWRSRSPSSPALDPDELEDDPLYWDEGADDEVD